MNRNRVILGLSLVFAVVLNMVGAEAMPAQGDTAKSFKAKDIRGQDVDLDQIMKGSPDMVVLFFFSTKGSDEFAIRLAAVDKMYGRKNLKIIAFGYKEQEAALKIFADKLHIEYYILPSGQVDADGLYGPISTLPVTFILKNDKTIVSVIQGGGETSARLLTKVAETYLMQGKSTEAKAIADEGAKAGEDKKEAGTVKGTALVLEGKLDDAEKEFKQIDSKDGLAALALQKGDTEKAITIANEAGPNNGYADTVKAKALMRTGKLDEAAKVLEGAASKPAMDFQKSETIVGQGRVQQEKGKTDESIVTYEKALNLNPYSITALSNEGAAHRQKGDLKKAAETLERVEKSGVAPDSLVTMMLSQVQDEMKKANDTKRGELIRQQIKDLEKRYQELKAAGKDKPADEWTTRPLVVAFLPSDNKSPVFFERAGTDVALRREIESKLQASGKAQVVEREMLDKLLQELNLGSSEVANPDTQLKLGKVLAAKYLGFVDYSQAGPDTLMYLRMVDTETTQISANLTENLKGADDLGKFVTKVVDGLTQKIAGDRKLQGLVAKVEGDTVLINLGSKYGLKPGAQFAVLKDGEPIEVGGKKLAGKPTKVATIEITEVDEDLSTCKIVEKSEGAKLAKEMKIVELAKK
ncbi:MAG: redoxin domain-containing protein [Candidatus Hydrogenedentes bacterium]|nr:redoxin domain-containing protein [Candidatus Hydrogenedentota bacterium]